MIKEVKYRVLTDREAILEALESDWRAAGQIINLRKGDTLTISYPVTITVDIDVAKQVLKEYLNENSDY